jgi:hypothetical protein
MPPYRRLSLSNHYWIVAVPDMSRLAEPSTRSGVSASTIKYYLRLGLLHSGKQQSSTSSTYNDSHLWATLSHRGVRSGGLGLWFLPFVQVRNGSSCSWRASL